MQIFYDEKLIVEISGSVTGREAVEAARGVVLGDFDTNLVERVPSTASETRYLVRERISSSAGDVTSILGTTADGALLAIHGLAKLVAALSTAQTLDDVRAAAAPFAAISADFLAKVESGDVVLPFLLKGNDAVFAEIETRSTAVSTALQDASGS